MILSESDARSLAAKALSFSKADSCSVTVSGVAQGNIRFALNIVTTSGWQDNLSLSIESNYGNRSGSVSINDLDEGSIRLAMPKSE